MSATTLRQLTIDGREVSHPPPKPRVTCPTCRKTVALTIRGELRKHKDEDSGLVCSMAGHRYDP